MKKALQLIIVTLLISGCSSSKIGSKLKTLNTKEFTVNYPNTWVKFGAYGYFYFTPKVIKKDSPEDELNNLSLNRNILNVEKSESIETAIANHGNTLRFHEKSRKGKLYKIKEESKFIYKTESTIEYNNFDGKYKSVEYFYLLNDEVNFITFQMKENIFDKYFNDAMIIINSFNPKA